VVVVPQNLLHHPPLDPVETAVQELLFYGLPITQHRHPVVPLQIQLLQLFERVSDCHY